MSREKFNPVANAKNLPASLVRQLKLSNDVEDQILAIFAEGGGTLNVSEVLVGLYQLYQKEETRQHVTAILYRMRIKHFIKPTGKKGEYTTQI